MNEATLQKISDYISEAPEGTWMSDIFQSLSIDYQFQAIDAIFDLIENHDQSIEEATSSVFTSIAYQMGIEVKL